MENNRFTDLINDKPDPNKNQTDEAARLMCDRIIGAGSVTFEGESLKNHVAVLLKYNKMKATLERWEYSVCDDQKADIMEVLTYDPIKFPENA